MKQVYVYADFDWMDEPMFVGELRYESIRGEDNYGFRFSESWLASYGSLFISEDLNSFSGFQYTKPGKNIFGCFSDALPDRWGRTLLKRREGILADKEGRAVRRLSSFDFLIGIDDFSRMGGFRFKTDKDSDFINTDDSLRIPPIANIRELEYASREIERSEEMSELPEEKWLLEILAPGSSLGGARPKANIIDKDDRLYIAKFPSRKDDYDIGLWEHFSHIMANKAGINTAVTRPILSSDRFHILLSLRFDRKEGKRVHFASAMTMLGLSDGDNASSGYGYLDILDFIIRHSSRVEENIKEIYRRIAFSICIANTDDHFRNHGFLLTPKGWVLSPAYDMNPTLNQYHSLLITRNSNKSDLNVLIDASDDYMLMPNDRDEIIDEVITAMRSWKDIATSLNLPRRDISMFEPVFDRYL